MVGGQPLARLFTSEVKVPRDDEAKARIFESDQKILQPFQSYVGILMAVEADHDDLAQAGMLRLNRHRPVT